MINGEFIAAMDTTSSETIRFWQEARAHLIEAREKIRQSSAQLRAAIEQSQKQLELDDKNINIIDMRVQQIDQTVGALTQLHSSSVQSGTTVSGPISSNDNSRGQSQDQSQGNQEFDVAAKRVAAEQMQDDLDRLKAAR